MKINLSLIAIFLVSLIVWLALSAESGGGEAWDGGSYWSIGLPVIYLAGGLVGYAGRVSAWKLGLASAFGQFAGLLITASGWSLWPLGLIMLAVLSLPTAVCAALGQFLRARLSAAP